ncbi:MAG: hypothetical protein IPM21_03035 [Acidobacteria bacterium]|nr:hypothetical protein [Acidobacteriota bacterium]
MKSLVRIAAFSFFAIVLISLTACDPKPAANSSSTSEVKGVAPVADNEIAVIRNGKYPAYGTIKIELYSNIADGRTVQRASPVKVFMTASRFTASTSR